MKVSVITVCFNNGSLLADAIRSVAAQSYPGIEYIVVDGQSTDQTPEIIHSFEDVITRWISEPDQGQYDAMNKGVGMATGDLIGFLHADDFFAHTDAIAHMVEAIGKKGADAVFGDIRYVDSSDTSKVLTRRKYGPCSRMKLHLGWHPPHTAFYVRSSVLKSSGLFDTSFTISADYDLMLRLLTRNKISTAYIPEVVVKMRVGGVSNRTMGNVRRKWREDYRAMQKNHFGSPLTIFLKTMRPVAHFIHAPRYLFE